MKAPSTLAVTRQYAQYLLRQNEALIDALRALLPVAARAQGAYTQDGATMEQARAALAKVEGK